jgi:hypothetical protein
MHRSPIMKTSITMHRNPILMHSIAMHESPIVKSSFAMHRKPDHEELPHRAQKPELVDEEIHPQRRLWQDPDQKDTENYQSSTYFL